MSADLLPPMKWNAWGDPDEAKPLSEGIRSLLTQALGVTGSPEAELAADQVQLTPSPGTSGQGYALIWGASTNCWRSTRCPEKPNSAPVSPGHKPRNCWART